MPQLTYASRARVEQTSRRWRGGEGRLGNARLSRGRPRIIPPLSRSPRGRRSRLRPPSARPRLGAAARPRHSSHEVSRRLGAASLVDRGLAGEVEVPRRRRRRRRRGARRREGRRGGRARRASRVARRKPALPHERLRRQRPRRTVQAASHNQVGAPVRRTLSAKDMCGSTPKCSSTMTSRARAARLWAAAWRQPSRSTCASRTDPRAAISGCSSRRASSRKAVARSVGRMPIRASPAGNESSSTARQIQGARSSLATRNAVSNDGFAALRYAVRMQYSTCAPASRGAGSVAPCCGRRRSCSDVGRN